MEVIHCWLRAVGNGNLREFGNIVPGAFTPVLAKHTKSFNLVDTLSVGEDRLDRLEENIRAAAVALTSLRDIENAASKIVVQGARYSERIERMSNR